MFLTTNARRVALALAAVLAILTFLVGHDAAMVHAQTPSVPGKPTELDVTPTYTSSGTTYWGTKVRLDWTAATTGGTADSWEYRQTTADTFTNETWRTISGSGAEFYGADGERIKEQKTYRFQVRGRNTAGAGEASDSAKLIRKVNKPNVSLVNLDTKIHVKWSITVTEDHCPITDFDVFYRRLLSTNESEVDLDSDDRTYFITGLTNGITYQVTVKASSTPCGLWGIQSDYDVSTPVTSPKLWSIRRQEPGAYRTNADSVTWRLTFTEGVRNVDANDFVVRNTTATLTVAAVGDSQSVYDVTASGGNLAGLPGTNISLFFTYDIDPLIVLLDIEDLTGAEFVNPNPLFGSDRHFGIDNTPPGKPTGLTATPGDQQVVLGWTAPSDDDLAEYQVRYKAGTSFTASETGTGAWADIADSDADTVAHTVTGLTTDTEYVFGIRAVDTATNPGAASDDKTATPLDLIPAFAPNASIADQELTQDTAYTSATAFPVATGGNLPLKGYSVDSLPSGITLNNTATDDSYRKLTGTATAPLAKTSLTYTATDNDDSTADDSTATLPFNISVAPKKPESFTATGGDGEVTLSWDVIAGVSGWQVKQDTGSWTDISGSSATTSSHTVTGLSNSTLYSFKVRAVVGAGNNAVNGVASDAASATPIGASGAPRELVAVRGEELDRNIFKDDGGFGSGAGDLLSWFIPDDDKTSLAEITGWQYRAKLQTAADWTGVSWTDLASADVTNGGTDHPIARIWVLVEGLDDTAVDVQVRAVKGALGGAATSVELAAAPSPAPPLAAPTALSAKILDGWTPELSWMAPAGTINGYEYRHRLCPCGGLGAEEGWSEAKGLNGYGAWLYLDEAYTPPTKKEVLGLPAYVDTSGNAWTSEVQLRGVSGIHVRQQRSDYYKGAWSASVSVGLMGGYYHRTTGTWSVSATPGYDEVTFGWTLPVDSDGAADLKRFGNVSVQIAWWETADGVPAAKRWLNVTPYGELQVTGSRKIEWWTPETEFSYQFAYWIAQRRFVQKDANGAEVTNTFTTLARPDYPPKPTVDVKFGDAKILMCWTAVDAAPPVSSYEYRFFSLTAGTPKHADEEDWQNADKSLTSKELTGLTNDSVYVVQLRAFNSVGVSDKSEYQTVTPVSGTTDPTCGSNTLADSTAEPPAATTLSGAPGNGVAHLTWTAIDGVDGWEYRQNEKDSTTNTTWTAIGGSGAATNSHTVTGLDNAKEYDFKVRAYVGTGDDRVNGVESNQVTVDVADLTPTLSGAIADQELTQDTAYTSATAFPEADGGDGAIAYTVDGLPSGLSLNDDRKLTGTATAPLAKTQLTYRATDSDATGPDSDTLTFNISVAPRKPATFTATTGVAQATLSWAAITGVSGWEYQQDGGDWTAIASSDATTNSHTVTGLTNGTAYTFKVRAFVGTGGARVNGVESDDQSATPAASNTPPATPDTYTVTHVRIDRSATGSAADVAAAVKTSTGLGDLTVSVPAGSSNADILRRRTRSRSIASHRIRGT